jgi:hypothetical protein
MESIDILKIILSYLIPTVLGGLLGYISTKLKKNKKEEEAKEQKEKAIEEGLQALLRNELVRRYREYETKGEMSILDKENIEAMFKQYEILGGNGTVKHLMGELLNLPTKIMKD